MGKKAKTGKKRKDKFYHLAKETGYRARSAFKLIQLNRKFNFLQESRVLIDLCAAPGGWLQVASNFMPISSIILGVDLDPIKPIKHVTTFQTDITTDHCRQLLKKELKGWKSDVVLNDGAPNVGTAWIQDAFTQAQLALSALKLASEFLKKGGWFITKVFRSKDYTALLWVFQQLFKRVHATKPQASRHESAEIFVVCQGFLAPDKLDPKFLDPKHVFKEIQDETKIKLNLLKPEKQTRQREGYPENNPTLHTTITAKEFITSSTALELLASANKIAIKDDDIKSNKLTTNEIVECCEDIKVLGKKELKNLLTWRKKLRKIFKIDEEKSTEESSKKEEGTVETEKTEEEKQGEIDQMVIDLKDEEDKELKKKRKRVRELKKKLRERLANKLASAPGEDDGMEQDLFALNLMKNKKEKSTSQDVDVKNQELNNITEDDDGDDIYTNDSGDELEFESDHDDSGADGDENDDDEDDDSSSDEESYVYGDDELYEKPNKKMKYDKIRNLEQNKLKERRSKTSDNPLVVDNVDDDDDENDEATEALNKAKQWYQKDVFKNADDDEDDDDDDEYDMELMLREHKKKGGKIIEKQKDSEKVTKKVKKEKVSKTKPKPSKEDEDDMESENEPDNESDVDSDSDSELESDSGDDSEIDDRSISQGRLAEQHARAENKETKENKKNTKNGFDIVPQVQLGAEALALGTAMVTSRKRKRDIIDDSYNRYSYNDPNLPSWFVEDEARHTVRHIPVTREEVEFYKQRLRDINARPIKKVIEAKAKKKSQMLKKLDRARRKAQGILDATDVSNREKQDQIKGIYKRAGLTKKKPPKPTFVVAKKGLAGKRYKRPDGVKGVYKVVDPRMKKDLKAMKNKQKTKGRSKKKK